MRSNVRCSAARLTRAIRSGTSSAGTRLLRRFPLRSQFLRSARSIYLARARGRAELDGAWGGAGDRGRTRRDVRSRERPDWRDAQSSASQFARGAAQPEHVNRWVLSSRCAGNGPSGRFPRGRRLSATSACSIPPAETSLFRWRSCGTAGTRLRASDSGAARLWWRRARAAARRVALSWLAPSVVGPASPGDTGKDARERAMERRSRQCLSS